MPDVVAQSGMQVAGEFSNVQVNQLQPHPTVSFGQTSRCNQPKAPGEREVITSKQKLIKTQRAKFG